MASALSKTPQVLKVRAQAHRLKVGPRKVNDLARLIRGRPVDLALADLTFSRRRIATEVKRCLNSAIANAENNFGYDIDRLVVDEAYVGKALMLKRMRPRARGRGSIVRKMYTNLTIILRVQDEEKA